jgi:hypothetical protein
MNIPAADVSDTVSSTAWTRGAQRRRAQSKRSTGVRGGVCLVLLAGLIGAGVVMTSRGPAEDPAPTTVSTEQAGFRVSVPAAWRRTPIPEGLLLQIAGENAVSIKRTTLAHEVDAADLDAVRAVTDAALSTPDAHLTILKSEATSVGGLPGVYYLYSFPSGQRQGAHTHYFLFAGRDMFTLVFQALPATDFPALASSFDAVVDSFRVSG